MLCLKVDVDTYRGLKDGLPALLELFKTEGVRASIYITFGPDNSGKAVKRVFTKKGFLKKMFRTNAAKLYGFKTMLYGTLLPAPLVGDSFPELLQRAASEGHEIGVHAWDHVRWQDDLDSMTEKEIVEELDSALASWGRIFPHYSGPLGFAAPAWKINEQGLKSLVKKKAFTYYSIARSSRPAYPSLGAVHSSVPDIPTTLPTLDEILAWDGMTLPKALDFLAAAPDRNGLNVYTLHTEAEGLSLHGFFSALLRLWKADGHNFCTLSGAAAEISVQNTPRADYVPGILQGRAGEVAAFKFNI